MYPGTLRLIQKLCTERVHGNFLVSFNIETNSKMFLPKGSMEISMYPVILRLILLKNVLPKGSMEISMYPLTSRLIQKCFYLEHPWIFPCIW